MSYNAVNPCMKVVKHRKDIDIVIDVKVEFKELRRYVNRVIDYLDNLRSFAIMHGFGFDLRYKPFLYDSIRHHVYVRVNDVVIREVYPFIDEILKEELEKRRKVENKIFYGFRFIMGDLRHDNSL